MELRQMRYLIAVVERSSVSAAARDLHLSQPALSRQIGQLEQECGVPLFERVPTGVRPTPAGSALYQHSIGVVRAAGAALAAAREAGPVRETVQVGLSPGTPSGWVRAVIDAVRDDVPHASLALYDASSAQQLSDLRAGRSDLGLVHQPPPPELSADLIHEQPFGLAVEGMAFEASLTGAGALPMAALHGHDVLAHAREQLAIGHDQLVTAAHEAGVVPRWHFASYVENAWACAYAAGATAAVVSEPTARRLLPGWSWYPLCEPTTTLRTWLARQSRTRSVVAEVARVIGEVSTAAVADDPPHQERGRPG